MADDEPKTVKVQFLEVELSGNRKVWLGFSRDEEDGRSYFFKFFDSEGHETKLRLSEEAFAAAIRLKADIDVMRDTGTMVKWQMKIEPELEQTAQ